MFDHQLVKLCRARFEAQVKDTFKRKKVAAAIGELLGDFEDDLARCSNNPGLRASVVRALMARERFERVKPAWMGGYALPLNQYDCRLLQELPDPRQRLVGWFAESLYLRQWPACGHPEFREHAQASLATPWVDADMRQELQGEFPPQQIDTKKYEGVMVLAGRTVNLDSYHYECIRD